MGERIAIIVASVLFFLPGCILALLSPTNGNPDYASFIVLLPFLSTYPFPMWASDGHEVYENAWAVVAGLATLGFAIFGLVTGKPKHAWSFVALLAAIWALALFRFVAMNHHVYN
jgi:hypothetical protein